MVKSRDGWHCRECGAKIHDAKDDACLCGWCRLMKARAAGEVP